METKLLKVNEESINLACELLKSGEIVGVPTETVYGLAGDARNPQAVKKIFEAKGRPQDNPLIVHISDMEMLKDVVSIVPDDATTLAKVFWPGPLTIVMPKGKSICDETCAGLDSVGARMPSHPASYEIIKRSGVPFAAPSANISGRPSPTDAQTVYEDMNGKIPLIIDGGECDKGVESTVVSVLGDTPIILRPGVITKEMLENALGKRVEIARGVIEEVNNATPVLSPGMKYKHYAPKAEITILKGGFDKYKQYVESHCDENTYALCFDEEQNKLNIKSVSYGKRGDALSQTHKLFSALRELDSLGAKTVYARCPELTGVSLAVYNRLIRAAAFRVILL